LRSSFAGIVNGETPGVPVFLAENGIPDSPNEPLPHGSIPALASPFGGLANECFVWITTVSVRLQRLSDVSDKPNVSQRWGVESLHLGHPWVHRRSTKLVPFQHRLGLDFIGEAYVMPLLVANQAPEEAARISRRFGRGVDRGPDKGQPLRLAGTHQPTFVSLAKKH
jgi:hypothetical protein